MTYCEKSVYHALRFYDRVNYWVKHRLLYINEANTKKRNSRIFLKYLLLRKQIFCRFLNLVGFKTYEVCKQPLMKLLPILASLSKKDWHWLQKFVNSPIYNQHAAVVKLFEFFRKKPPVSEKSYSSEILHKNLFPETPFDASKTHHAVNYLLRSTEDFLAWDSLRSPTQNDRA